MNYKIEGAIRRNKKNFIICAILWFLLTIVFVVPFTYSVFKAKQNGMFSLDIFLEQILANVMNPLGSFKGIIEAEQIGSFFSTLFGFTIIYLIFVAIGLMRSAPKSEYSDFEHGSSDWSKSGEQYRVLDKRKGIVLAENNFLPVDKRGNVNVLVVGRFRCW